jgi:hypothetical protein
VAWPLGMLLAELRAGPIVHLACDGRPIAYEMAGL